MISKDVPYGTCRGSDTVASVHDDVENSKAELTQNPKNGPAAVVRCPMAREIHLVDGTRVLCGQLLIWRGYASPSNSFRGTRSAKINVAFCV
jgi:hypothetical protein